MESWLLVGMVSRHTSLLWKSAPDERLLG